MILMIFRNFEKRPGKLEENVVHEIDALCLDLLRETHPDRAGDKRFSATEVAAFANQIREMCGK